MVEQPLSSLPNVFHSISDLTIIFLVSVFLLFSFFSFFFILHFHYKTRNSHHLKHFTSLWSVRILLVAFISLWAFSEIIHLLFTHGQSISLPTGIQENICKYHVVLTQGLLEPGFLVTLLYLVNFSIKKKDPEAEGTFGSALSIVLAICFPVLVLQVFFVFFVSKNFFDPVLWRSYIIVNDKDGDETVLCTYPLFSTIVFGTFAAIYTMVFLFACCKVVSLVINKGLRVRIYALAFTILFALPVEVVCLAMSTAWSPGDVVHNGLDLIIFLTVLLCAVVGQGVLVIRPIADALAVGQNSCWLPREEENSCWLPREEDRLPVVLEGKGSATTSAPVIVVGEEEEDER